MSTKQRWSYADAMKVGEQLVVALAPFCERIEIAGSLRRKKADVGDVEIIYIPKFEERAADMFSTEQFNVADWEIGCLVTRGTLSKRPNKNGGFSYGEKNKLLLHHSGIPVDLFSTNKESWFNYLVCRTGGAENNVAIAAAAKRKGWQWNPYGSGFSRGERIHAVKSEREVFEFVGLQFQPPEKR